MKAYNILKLNSGSEYDGFVVICNANSAYDYLEQISKELNQFHYSGKILVDQMMHTGNTQKRFMVFEFQKNKLVNGNFINLNKDSIYRKMTCEYLKESNFLEGSILTSIQRRMIQKGIII